jgi:hypothetical protein
MPNPVRRRRLAAGRQTFVKAAMFNGANSQFLNIADNAALSMGAGVHPTIVAWICPQNVTVLQRVLAKGNSTAATAEYSLILSSTALVQSQTGDGTAFTTVSTSPINANQWVFIAFQYDGTNDQVSLNNGSFVTTSHTTDILDGTNNLRLGTRSDGSNPYTGAINQVGIAKSLLSATELTELYNGGKGKNFAQISAALAAKFSAYWDLSDAGGSGATWLDKASTNHLTAGTTTAAPTSITLLR